MHFYRNDSYFYIGNLTFLSGSRWNESLYFMSSVIVSNEFSSVETIIKRMFKSRLSLIIVSTNLVGLIVRVNVVLNRTVVVDSD